MFCNTLTCFS